MTDHRVYYSVNGSRCAKVMHATFRRPANSFPAWEAEPGNDQNCGDVLLPIRVEVVEVWR